MSGEAIDERVGPTPSSGSLAPLAFTVVTRNHFHLAAGWAEQLRRVDRTARALIVVADADDPLTGQPDWDFLAACHQDWRALTPSNASDAAVSLRSARQLVPDNHWRLAFQYSPLELTCCLKGRIAAALWARGERHLLYTDADTRLYDSVAACLAPLSGSGGILLTPHLREPLPEDGCYPNNADLLRAGAFNAGVLGWSDGTNSNREIPDFFQWWNCCTEQHCIVEPGLGLFVDQRWLDQAPGLFPSVVIARHFGLNVGYWNLHDRRVYRQENRWWVAAGNDSSMPTTGRQTQPLQIFHFSGAAPFAADGTRSDHRLSRHQNRHALTAHSDLANLVQTYMEAWQQHAADHYSRLPYRYGSLTSGVSIAPEWRDAFRLNSCGLREIEQPFATFSHMDGLERLQMAARPPHLPAGRMQHQIDALHNRIDQLKRKLDRSLWRRWAKAAKQWRQRWWRKP